MARSAIQGGRRRRPEPVEAEGEDELASLTYLAVTLLERQQAATLDLLATRSRLAYLDGAEAHTRSESGRSLSTGELKNVLARFPRGA